MSALSKMAAKISASKMPPPAPRKSKSNSESERVITTESDAIGITYKPSDSIVASSPGPSQGDLKKFRPFAPISPFSGPRDVNGKPDVTSLEGIDIPTEPLKIFANRGFLSKHQLPISQWYMHTSYLATVVDKQSMIPVSANIDETPRRAKHEDVLNYVYDWAAWAAEIRDEARRTEVLGWVTRALERVLKEGMERTGMLLTPNDVSGTKSGMKKAPEGEVNIQVIITSSIKEKPVKKLDKLAMQKTNDNVAKSNQAKTGVAAGMPSEPAPELLVSIEEASKASLMKAKRVANEMDPADVEQDAKRQKLDNEASKNIEAPIANATDLQQQPTTLEKFSRSTSESMSPAEEEKRTRYLQQIFQPRVNHILKKAGLSQTRGKCKNWDTVKTRLTEAGVSVKYRNIMLKDFCSGHSAWNGDSSVDPNEELALYAHGGFKSGLGKASAGTDNKVDAKTEENGVQPNMSDTATLLSALESMPVLNTESPIPDTFVPAQPVRSFLFSSMHQTTSDLA
jgi:hypothetical protein